MAKRDTLRLSQHQFIEASTDTNGRYFIAYSQGASVFLRERKELLRFLKVPKSIPMRASLDAWLQELESSDQGVKPKPIDGLSAEHIATGFGPEVHGLDESDPQFQTRMVT
jgi:hypothetical protein